jgi:hypothetical protein
MKPDVLLFVSVPNLDAWQHRVGATGSGSRSTTATHLFFTPATLDRLLRTTGFSIMG